MDSRRILNLHMAHHVPVVRVLLLKVEVELDGGAGMWMVRMWEAVDSPGLEKAVGTAALLAFVVCVGRVWCVCLPPFLAMNERQIEESFVHYSVSTLRVCGSLNLFVGVFFSSKLYPMNQCGCYVNDSHANLCRQLKRSRFRYLDRSSIIRHESSFPPSVYPVFQKPSISPAGSCGTNSNCLTH